MFHNCSLVFQNSLDRAQAAKNKGNKYFKAGKYEQAIQCYTEAISLCPTEKNVDLSTFYQNRAAAFEQLVCTVGWFFFFSLYLHNVSANATQICLIHFLKLF